MSLFHGLFRSCLWAEVHPDIADPVSDKPDKVCNRSERADVAAPRPADEEGSNEHYSQQHKMKVGSNQMKKGTKDLIAGDARVAVEESDHDRAKG